MQRRRKVRKSGGPLLHRSLSISASILFSILIKCGRGHVLSSPPAPHSIPASLSGEKTFQGRCLMIKCWNSLLPKFQVFIGTDMPLCNRAHLKFLFQVLIMELIECILRLRLCIFGLNPRLWVIFITYNSASTVVHWNDLYLDHCFFKTICS